MARFTDLDDTAMDDVLGGRTPDGHEELAPLANFAATVRARSAARERPVIGSALSAQIRRHPHVPARHVGMVHRRLAVAGAGVALAVVGAAASQNALPDDLQRIVSLAGDVVGLDIPRPDDEPDVPVGGSDAPGSTSSGSEGKGGPGGSTGNAGDAPPETTPGGATPADPGTPGDGEPATPATPPPHSSGGEGGDRGEAGQSGDERENEGQSSPNR